MPDPTQPTPEDDTEGSILRSHPKAQVEEETAVEDDTQGSVLRSHPK
jgi:hypothetical protein